MFFCIHGASIAQPTPSAFPTISTLPTMVPSVSQQPSVSPTIPPSVSPTVILRSVSSRRFMILDGLSTVLVVPVEDVLAENDPNDNSTNNNSSSNSTTNTTNPVVIVGDANGGTANKTMDALRWENWTTQFVAAYWTAFFQSPFAVQNVDTRLLSATRLNHTTANTNTTTVQPVLIVYRQRMEYRILDWDRAEALFGHYNTPEFGYSPNTPYAEALFLEPFHEPFFYTNPLATLLASTETVTLVATGIDRSNTPAPVPPPTGQPTTGTPTASPLVPDNSGPLDEPNERRIIAFVIVVVVISVCVAAGYLYYLVRKEDGHAIVGDLPDDLVNGNYRDNDGEYNYYAENNTEDNNINNNRPAYVDNLPPPRTASSTDGSLPAVLRPSGSSDEDLDGAPAPPRSQSISAGRSGSGGNKSPPPMAVLDDVLPQDGGGDLLGDIVVVPSGNGDAVSSDEYLDVRLDGLGHNPSFDSNDGRTTPAFDMTGFQVQNLDDM